MPSRYYIFAAAVVAFFTSVALEFTVMSNYITWPSIAITGFLAAVGLIDITQTKQAIRRNYPILAHCRFSSNTSAPRCGNTSSRAITKPRRFRAPHDRWCISAPCEIPINGRLVRSLMCTLTAMNG